MFQEQLKGISEADAFFSSGCMTSGFKDVSANTPDLVIVLLIESQQPSDSVHHKTYEHTSHSADGRLGTR
jgi:hypothetical protein